MKGVEGHEGCYGNGPAWMFFCFFPAEWFDLRLATECVCVCVMSKCKCVTGVGVSQATLISNQYFLHTFVMAYMILSGFFSQKSTLRKDIL